jgi:hypothetical protein
MFGTIFRLMVDEGLEISVTLAWRLIVNSIQYGDPPDHPTEVWYSWRLCLDAKKIHDEVAGAAGALNKRGRTEEHGFDEQGVHACLEQMKGLMSGEVSGVYKTGG